MTAAATAASWNSRCRVRLRPTLLMSGPCITRFRDGTGGRTARVAAGGLTADYAALRTGFLSCRRAETAHPHSWTVPASMTKPRLSKEKRRISLDAAFWGSTQTTSTPAGLKNSTNQSSATSRVLNVRRRQSTNATSYWPAGCPQFAVAAARGYPRRRSSNISSTPLEPATTIRCCFEQPASAIIGSMMRSPAGVEREGVMMSPCWSNYCSELTRG
jgi:hypothetical protein